MIAPIPKNIELLEDHGNLIIRRKWFGPRVIFLTIFCIFWDGFLVAWFWIGSQQGNMPLAHFLFPLIHVAAGIGITYYVIACYVNKTDIVISPDNLSVKIYPIKWPGEGSFPILELKQLYTYEKVTRTKNGTSITYEVRILDRQNKEKTLVKGLDDKAQGLFIEKEIEKIIGVNDERVVGEVG
ncbi:hypothetical protein G0Q06_05720 [Puniceicoccales bacterium CK1056]|uniref:Uncharacterized protein n=1 Tax=Oceanipulchritudo coccoides TaxID=2706888 RepID=A0A6B2M0M2_9BACT|nr:hypothetical protein [Oceanipulchritudo coccoides]NDV61942.1 hypothetical protein [Oceanipulchritudo coccoides]